MTKPRLKELSAHTPEPPTPQQQKKSQLLSSPMSKQYLPRAPQPSAVHEKECTRNREMMILAGANRHLVHNAKTQKGERIGEGEKTAKGRRGKRVGRAEDKALLI